MANNTFLVFLILGGVILGALGGYFVFLGIYQEQFAQQEQISLDNFESGTAELVGVMQNIDSDMIIIGRKGVSFPLLVTETTRVLLEDTTSPDAQEVARATGRFPLREGEFEELKPGQTVRAVISFTDSNFRLVDVTILPPQ